MHPTSILRACRITLFTRANCSLCTNAKTPLSKVWDERPFLFKELDIMQADAKQWRDLYEFDVPVIHISEVSNGEEQADLSGKAKKLMHRFTAEQIHELMDQVEEDP